MGKNKNATKGLTQEEIWDDSALVQSWDEAVDEYKLYHSIQARGENVDDVLREAEAAELAATSHDQGQADDLMDEDVDPSAEASETAPVAPAEAPQSIEQPSVPPPSQNSVSQGAPPNPLGTAVPQAALAQVQDEGLKNLMMSWYYAGYYTGLYEGQQRANNNGQSRNP